MTIRIDFLPVEPEGPYPILDFQPEDAEECRAFGLHPQTALVDSIRGSLRAYTVLVDWEPVAVMGYSGSLAGGVASAWLLTDRRAHRYPLRFGLMSRRWIEFLHQAYPTVEVLVDTQHLKARRWLRWLGFMDHRPANDRFMFMRREA